MATYVPDPEDVLTPLDTDNIGNVTPPEIRALKQHIMDKFDELDNMLAQYNATITQKQTNVESSLDTKLNTINTTITNTLDPHLVDEDNPHSVTKSQIGLSLLQNFGISNATNLDSSTTYASAKAVKALMDSVASLKTQATALANSRTALINAAYATTSASKDNKLIANHLMEMPTNFLYLIYVFQGNGGSWTNNTSQAAIVLEVRRTGTNNSNIVHFIPANGVYTFNISTNLQAFVFGIT